jgi:3-oxoacyl-[acyl-carrier-protein] synthase-3
MDKVFVNLDRYGNTSSASTPIAFCEAIEQGRLKPGDHVVLVGFGAGLTWAAAVAWVAPAPVKRPSWWRRLLMTLQYWRAALLSFSNRHRRRIDTLWTRLRGNNDRV